MYINKQQILGSNKKTTIIFPIFFCLMIIINSATYLINFMVICISLGKTKEIFGVEY